MNILAQSVGRIDMPATNTDYDSELLPRLYVKPSTLHIVY